VVARPLTLFFQIAEEQLIAPWALMPTIAVRRTSTPSPETLMRGLSR
jgi:hypothetical protein